MAGANSSGTPNTSAKRRYDVALSYAGAQRGYVEQVATALKAQGLNCFYDSDEQVRMWGQDLAVILPRIYADESRLVVVFISAEYVERIWTRLEFRAALNRAASEPGVYMLPARFDASELHGLLPGVVYIDLRSRAPGEVANLVVAKFDELYPDRSQSLARAWREPPSEAMRLTLVGCGGSLPGPDTAASCYLLEADDFRLVVDLGNGSLGALQRYAGLFDVDAICLSHLHDGHCADLYSYANARTHSPAGPQPPIPVYGPRGTDEATGLIPGGRRLGELEKRFTFETLEPGRLTVGPFDIMLARMSHPVETFGFRFTYRGCSLCYTGDTGPTEAVPGLAAGVDVFLSEATFPDGPDLPPDLHLTAREAATYANRAGVGRLVLTHLNPWTSPDDTRAEATVAFDGDLDIASSGQVIDL